jgi:hypothetical protein
MVRGSTANEKATSVRKSCETGSLKVGSSAKVAELQGRTAVRPTLYHGVSNPETDLQTWANRRAPLRMRDKVERKLVNA